MAVITAKRLIAVGVTLAVAVGAGVAVLVFSGWADSNPKARPAATGGAIASEANEDDPESIQAKWVVDENAKPGTSEWRLTGPINNGNIEGYANVTSANLGESVTLYVSTDAPTFVVEAYRMGYYGGTQARRIWRSDTLPGSRQGDPRIDSVTNMVEAPWQPSLTVNIDESWPPGDYLFKLAASNGFGQYIPLAVRDDDSRAPLVVMNAVTTWQAYNTWGGHSLYEGKVGRSGYGGEGRANVVSFDRPYKNDSGSGDFLGNELPMVSHVESLGLNVTYVTNIDLHLNPQLLSGHRGLITLGHDEYWSLEMRDATERARDAGVNIAFFGANAVYRSIRLQPSVLGPARQEVNYRGVRDDPLRGVDNSRATVSWREAPLNRPESTLIGNFYECNPVEADMVVVDPAAWVFAGTGFVAGDTIPSLVGPEYDRYDQSAPDPPGPVQILAHSPLRCRGDASHSDMTYYSAPSGAGVLATGTNWWVSRLSPDCKADPRCDPRVATMTNNILEAFATGPAGRTNPSRSNYSEVTGRSTSSRTTVTTRPSTTSTIFVPPTEPEPVPTTRPTVPGPPPLPFPTIQRR